MCHELHQGDILKIERIEHPVLVVSKNFFNSSGEIIGCPIYENSTESPLHIGVVTKEIRGLVQCEKLALLDLSVRGHVLTLWDFLLAIIAYFIYDNRQVHN